MPYPLDFSLLPKLTHGRAFMRLDDGVVAGIASLRRVSERASNAIRFIYWAGAKSEVLRCTDSEAQQLREGCFRAALTEFASIEEVQLLDYAELGISRSPLRLNDTANPLLHAFREMRNLEVHLRQSALRSRPKDVLWGHMSQPSEATPITISIWTAEALTPQAFSLLRNARNYTSDQVTKMVSWVNAAQSEWGIQEVFLLAVEEYCRLLKTRGG
jgi:hypothetical protein